MPKSARLKRRPPKSLLLESNATETYDGQGGACSLLIEANPCHDPGMTTKCSQRHILSYCRKKNKFTLDQAKAQPDLQINVSWVSVLPAYEYGLLGTLMDYGSHPFALTISLEE